MFERKKVMGISSDKTNKELFDAGKFCDEDIVQQDDTTIVDDDSSRPTSPSGSEASEEVANQASWPANMTHKEIRSTFLLYRLKQLAPRLTQVSDSDDDEDLPYYQRPVSQQAKRLTAKPAPLLRPQTSLGYHEFQRQRQSRSMKEPVFWKDTLRKETAQPEKLQRKSLESGQLQERPSSSIWSKEDREFAHVKRWSVDELERLDKLLRPTTASQAREASVTLHSDISAPVFMSQQQVMNSRRNSCQKDGSVVSQCSDSCKINDRFTGKKRLNLMEMKKMVSRLSATNREQVVASRRQIAERRAKMGLFGNYYITVKDSETESRACLQETLKHAQLRAINLQKWSSRHP